MNNSITKSFNHQQSSIEVSRGKDGNYSWAIKVYFGNGMGTLDQAIAEIDNIDKKLHLKYLNLEKKHNTNNPVSEEKHEINGWATEKQINFLYAKARRLSGEKTEQSLEAWLIKQAIEHKVIEEEKGLKHFSVEQASSLIELLPQ